MRKVREVKPRKCHGLPWQRIALFIILIGSVLWIGCTVPTADAPASGTTSGDSTTAPPTPPEALKGTVAFGQQAAVIELTIGGAKALAPAMATHSKAIHDVGGRIRFGGQDFTITGTYDDVASAVSAVTSVVSINGHDMKFEILGVYDSTNGFRGSVRQLLDNVLLESGSVSAVATTNTEIASGAVRTFTGTYGGTNSQGTWNGALKDGKLKGTYSGYNSRGGYSGTVTGSTITIGSFWEYNYGTTSVVALTSGSANGTLNGSFMAGTWAVAGGTGFWTGFETDVNGDCTTVTTSCSTETRCVLLSEIIHAMCGTVDFTTGTAPYHNPAGTVSATVADVDASTRAVGFAATAYADILHSGLTVNGTVDVLQEIASERDTYLHILLTFSGSYATGLLGIASMEAVVNIDYSARTVTGHIYFDGNNTDNYISSYQALLFP
jgi:hypothetical protein